MIRFTVHQDGYTTFDGQEIKELNEEFESPLIPGKLCPGTNSYCYILYKNWFGKWQIKEEIVAAIYYTNTYSYKMSNGWCIAANELGKTLFLYEELDKAIDICIEKNRKRKVKIKYLDF